MKPITLKFLQAQVDNLNRITGQPMEPWTPTPEGYKPNGGNYHLDGAYGGYSLCQMCSVGSGTKDVFRSGHISKRDLSERISAFIAGIETAKEN